MRKIAIREEAARLRDGRSEIEQQQLLESIFSSCAGLEIPVLSRHWMADFLTRWKSTLTTRAPSSLTKARAKGLNRATVNEFFDRIEKRIQEGELAANCVANFDEKGFEGEGEDSSMVVVPAHFKHSDKVRGAYRDHWSVGVCVFASGFAVPPAVAFKGKRFPPCLMAKLPADSLACAQENGYFTQSTFPDILKHIHYHRPNQEKPILLVLDNSDTHLDAASAELARALNIFLEFLPPNCTHRLQPLDVSVFAPLSKFWTRSVRLFQTKSPDADIGRYQLSEIFAWAWKEAMKPQTIVSGFAKTGIFPLNREMIAEWEFKVEKSPRAAADIQTQPLALTGSVESLIAENQVLTAKVSRLESKIESMQTQFDQFIEEFHAFRENSPAALPAQGPKPGKRPRKQRAPMLKETDPVLLSASAAATALEQQQQKKTPGRKRKISQTRALADEDEESEWQPTVDEFSQSPPLPKRSRVNGPGFYEDLIETE